MRIFLFLFFLFLLLESSLWDFLWLNSLITLICNNVISNYNPDIFLSKARGEEGLVVRGDILTCLYPKKGYRLWGFSLYSGKTRVLDLSVSILEMPRMLGHLPVCSYAARPPKTSGTVTDLSKLQGKSSVHSSSLLGADQVTVPATQDLFSWERERAHLGTQPVQWCGARTVHLLSRLLSYQSLALVSLFLIT